MTYIKETTISICRPKDLYPRNMIGSKANCFKIVSMDLSTIDRRTSRIAIGPSPFKRDCLPFSPHSNLPFSFSCVDKSRSPFFPMNRLCCSRRHSCHHRYTSTLLSSPWPVDAHTLFTTRRHCCSRHCPSIRPSLLPSPGIYILYLTLML